MGSSCAGSIAVKSSLVKVIGGILGRFRVDVEWTNWMARRFFFLTELEHPPLAKPPSMVLISRSGVPSDTDPTIVLITSWTLRLARLFLSGLLLRGRVLLTGLSLRLCLVECWLSSHRRESPRPDRSLYSFCPLDGYRSLCRDRYVLVSVLMNFWKWHAWISSSILSSNAWYPSVVWL